MLRKTIYIGADSAGYEMKEGLAASLREEGYEVIDCGTNSSASCHYPEFAHAVCAGVQKAPNDSFGILICGTGIGMSMAANKHRGIRAALCSEKRRVSPSMQGEFARHGISLHRGGKRRRRNPREDFSLSS